MALGTIAGTLNLAYIGSIGLSVVVGVLIAVRGLRSGVQVTPKASGDLVLARAYARGGFSWCVAVALPVCVLAGTPAQLLGATPGGGFWSLLIGGVLFIPAAVLAAAFAHVANEVVGTMRGTPPQLSTGSLVRRGVVLPIAGVVVVWCAFAPPIRPLHMAVDFFAFFGCDAAESTATSTSCAAPWLWNSWVLTVFFTVITGIAGVVFAMTATRLARAGSNAEPAALSNGD